MGESSNNKIKDFFWKLKKNPKAQVIILVIFLVIVAAVAGLLIFYPGSANRITELVGNRNLNGTGDVRLIDGVKTNPGMENLFPQTIVIENLATVRPQAGLGEANLVYEFLAEGGITRFLAVYASGDNIELIGPVRSARHYIVDLSEEYHGLFAHIGGSPQALGVLNVNDYLVDLNQFGNPGYYWRDVNIGAPHNLFTSSDLMFFAQRDKVGEEAQGDYTPWKFKKETSKDERPTEEKSVKINFSSGSYEVEWKYNPDTNIYARFNGGLEHTDKNTEEQLTAKNIVVQYAETSLLEEGTGRLDIKTQGEGNAVVFMDGVGTEGTWKKDERGDRTLFYDANGDEIEFNPGKSWIEIVPTDKTIEYN
ncbi:DUF3048 domain-containing protein [Patescibacteria group bacterium]|nr:DUF3048 domain-containing protein [Patescibacteria group bacterium]MBU1672897.1 DUF3048 domain-containing protein [Patescibacteria group bacterium]MBU1963148.1 DUF3048 domain-containing protein [Patescibacteria group bacterium]